MAIAECLGAKPPDPDYPLAKSLGTEMAADSLGIGRGILKKYGRCVGAAQAQEFEAKGQAQADDLVNYFYRDQEAYALAKKIQLFTRRANVLKLGRDLAAQSVRFADSANSLLGGLAQGLAQTTNGAMSFLGYIRHREITAYPESIIGSMIDFAQGAAGGFGLFSPTSVDNAE
jgi:hypothetical protein